MKPHTFLCTLVILFSPVGHSAIAAPRAHEADQFILDNVNILDVENQTILASKQILVSDGKIGAIDDAGANIHDNDIIVIDGKGGYVTPGLIDMHVHLYDKSAFTIALSHGVTHVRVMNGVPAQLRWRDQLQRGELVGSTATVSSPIISAYEDAYLHRTVLSVDELKDAIREYKTLGYDLIKAYGNLSATVLAALAEESEKAGIPVAKHGPNASGDLPVSALSGFQSFEHVEDIFQGPLNYQFSLEPLPGIIAELKSTNVPITPTLNIYRQLTKLSADKEAFLETLPEDYISPIIALEANANQVKRWLAASEEMAAYNQKTLVFLQQITRQLHDEGVTLLVGSDSGVLLSPHGLATHTEMQLLEQAGLSPFEVITAATVNPAHALGLDTELGSIKLHYRADFLYTVANPIEDLRVLEAPVAVIKNGKWYTNEDLQVLREKAIASRSIWSELTTIFEAL